MASYSIVFAKTVRKDFKAIPKADAVRLLDAIHSLAKEPRPSGAKKLTGEELYRVRVGNYRVLYEIQDAKLIVMVVKVRHRKDIYRK